MGAASTQKQMTEKVRWRQPKNLPGTVESGDSVAIVFSVLKELQHIISGDNTDGDVAGGDHFDDVYKEYNWELCADDEDLWIQRADLCFGFFSRQQEVEKATNSTVDKSFQDWDSSPKGGGSWNRKQIGTLCELLT